MTHCHACGQPLPNKPEPEPLPGGNGALRHWWVGKMSAACTPDLHDPIDMWLTINPHHVTCPDCRKTPSWLTAIDYRPAPEVPNV